MTTLSFTQVEIDGFRGLRGLNLEGLGRVNILVGQNNCGKTSVLEALSILCNPKRPSEWLMMVHRRDFGRLDENIVQSLRWCFTQKAETNYDHFIEASCYFKYAGRFSNQLTVQYVEFMKHQVVELPIGENEGGVTEYIDEEYELRATKLRHIFSASYTNTGNTSFDLEVDETYRHALFLVLDRQKEKKEHPLFDIPYEMLTPYSYQLNRLQLKSQSQQLFNDDVIELLQDFDPDVEAVRIGSFSGERAAIYIKHRKLGEAPLSVFGDAMRRAVLLTSTLLSLKDGGVLLIDEVEVGIHVSALTNVFKWLVESARKLNVQVFVTTHSLEALDAITFSDNDDAEEDIVVFRLKQTEEKTESKRLSGDLLHRLRFERGLDVR